MNKRRLMKMTREIVLIRDLQRERALHDAKRAAHEHQRSLASSDDARARLDAQHALMREILTMTGSILPIELAANVRASVESAHSSMLAAQMHAAQADREAKAKHAIFADKERLHEAAETLADQASSACARADEKRHSNLVEDTYSARRLAL
ncbi:hypothetical protein BG58_41015 [Caballeronia jiangsuensis]|nr:hypothetical protein BG58_41015 [Caballeronia jiangsuensis]